MIYYGHSIFRKHNGRIIFTEFPRYKGKTIYGGLVRIGSEYIIDINKHVSWNQRVKTYLHELLHLGLEYPHLEEDIFSRGSRPGLENTIKNGKVVLGEIDSLVEVILKTQPRLVRYLRFDLERAYLSKRNKRYSKIS